MPGSRAEEVWVACEAQSLAVAALDTAERLIVNHALCEIVKNAIDHSCGTELSVQIAVDGSRLDVVVEDDGIGAFASVRRGKGLTSEIEAAAAIAEVDLTTMPQQRRGGGLFWLSKVADRFELHSNRTRLIVDTLRDDYAILEGQRDRGTRVEFRIARPPARTLADVFQAHTEEFEFVRTRTVVKLFGLGRDFVARSEARRILEGLDRFREIIVDFDGIPGIGQGFADEMFRVFANQHPDIRLVPIRMNTEVEFFVERALRAWRGQE
ncbi:MAG: DUF4325 domain-containing protein [Planctomycetota bacterium]